MSFMENGTFKSVAFGGFEKEGVVAYIEKLSQEHTAETESLRRESEALRGERDTLSDQLGETAQKLKELSAAHAALREELERLRAENAELQPLKPEEEHLRAEADALRPDAEAYRQFRNRIGDIECDARKRAAELESVTNARMSRAVSDLKDGYQTLAATFASASDYITGELRKVEVNLSQLPRALDRMGSELEALENSLDHPETK